MDNYNNTGVVVLSFSNSNKGVQGDNEQREFALFDNLNLAVPLCSRDNPNIQRSTDFNKDSTACGLRNLGEMQHLIWNSEQRNNSRKLPTELVEWRFFKDNNRGG